MNTTLSVSFLAVFDIDKNKMILSQGVKAKLFSTLSFKPTEKCCTDFHHCFQWETIFCEKKNPKMDETGQNRNRICSIIVDSKLSQCDLK